MVLAFHEFEALFQYYAIENQSAYHKKGKRENYLVGPQNRELAVHNINFLFENSPQIESL